MEETREQDKLRRRGSCVIVICANSDYVRRIDLAREGMVPILN